MNIKIKMLPIELRLELILIRGELLNEFVKFYMDLYESQAEFDYKTNLVGESVAEEMFDLTNNPNRQDEREILYGTKPSISVGDIVEVDGIDYFCSSIGWKIL